MAAKVTADGASNAIQERLARLAIHGNNVRTFVKMAENAKNEGDETLAKRHLRKALDIEFEMFAETPAVGELANLWYPGQEI